MSAVLTVARIWRRPTCIAVAVTVAAACSSFSNDPGKRVVARVGGQPVALAQLQAYLDANVFQDSGADPVPPGDLARVKSRLVDDFLDGEVLLQESKRRGLSVSDEELAGYLGSDATESPAARETARRDLTIQKLREAVVLADVSVSEAEIDAWLAARDAEAGGAAVTGVLQVLRLASYPEAVRVRKEIVSRKLSFREAGEAYGADSIPDAPRENDLSMFPPRVADAVKALKPGEVTPPVPFETSVLLFFLEPASEASTGAARRRERARQALSLEKAEAAEARLIEGLRAKTKVVLLPEELPFRYVAERGPARAE